jgi:hypothetical protein
MRRTLNQAGNPIAVAINVDQFSINRYRIAAHQIIIRKNGPGINLSCFFGIFGCCPVN